MNKIENRIKQAFQTAVKSAFDYNVELESIGVELPRDKSHGDYALNIAMQLTKVLRQNPVIIANKIIENLDNKSAGIVKVEIAGPGFINLTMDNESITSIINVVLEKDEDYGRSDFGNNEKYNIEYVSANPTGDLHPGHARGAAMGDAISRLMKFAGYDVTREYYINDAGNQIINMAKSLQARYFQEFSQEIDFPEDGYRGQDLIEIAKELAIEVGEKYLTVDLKDSLADFKAYGIKMELAKIKRDLEKFNVEFDVWTSELSLYQQNMIEKSLERLAKLDMTYESEGALWLKTTNFNDDKDRVLKKNDGSYTYLTPDISYHLNKFERGYEKLVDLLGADHHGYINRLKAAISALGYQAKALDIDIIQMVRLIKDGEEYKMSKRTGNALSLRELIDEAGADALRYFFVSRAADTHMDLDLDMVTKQSNENPVYYVQYAHARMCSILRNVDEIGIVENFDLLTNQKEIDLMKQINEFTSVVVDAASSRQPHKVCNYIHKLATLFHSFYGECKCICEDENLQNQRLSLVRATQITLRNGLKLIGVNAIERM